MSCMDVMYQPYSAAYFGYQRASTASSANIPSTSGYFLAGPSSPQDFASTSTFEHKPDALHFEKFNSPPALKENYSTPSPPQGHISPGTSSPTIVPIDLPSTSTAICSPSPEVSETKEDIGVATYLSSKCVVIKYYKTDLASAVDDHFQKALAQAGFGGPSRRNDDETTDVKPLAERNLPQSFFCPPQSQQLTAAPAAATTSGSYPPSPSSTSSYPQVGPSQASPQMRVSPHLSGHPSPSYVPLPSTSTSLPLTDFYSTSTPSTSDYDPWSHYVQGYRTAQLSGHDLQTYAAAANRHQFAQQQYNSLLSLGNQQPRASCSAAVLGVNEKVMDTWGQSVARYHEQIQMNINMGGHSVAIQEPYSGNYAHPMSAAMTGLEATADSKDMYWFQ